MRVRTIKDENTTAQKSNNNNNNNNNNNKQLAALFLVALTLENTASMLARRYAVGILQLDFSKNVVLCANEFMKLAFSIFMKYRKMDVRSLKGLRTHVFKRVVKTATPMLVPAFVYLVVNLISYPSLQRVDASVFTAISNLKVLATAIFAQILLDSRISNRVWRTLTQLVLGVTLISWESSPNNPVIHKRVHQNWYEHISDLFDLSYAFGVFLALLQTMLSGFGSVYFEKVLKNRAKEDEEENLGKKLDVESPSSASLAKSSSPFSSSTELDVWDRNIQLALCSILIYVPISIYETKGNLFQGWTFLVIVIAALHALGGILVALSVLYSSSVTKTVAVCAALVLTTVFGHILFFEPLNGPILLGCAMVIISVWAYKDDAYVEAKLRSAGFVV
jgi:drug/metabolite transporter (DMT)-like permease